MDFLFITAGHQIFFMIKLQAREMKNLSRILIGLLCFAPFAHASAAPVATTSGSNLTAFNPSNAYNNQWATVSNGRYDSNPTAKADFKNCEAIVLRCASPRCANGGCTDITVASGIVNGCVQSNEKCKQYGQDLVNSLASQLVATSTAKVNEQNAAAQQAAATAAAQQSQQQLQQMQYQMQQMQQQMANQQAQSQQQLQEALAQQAAQSQTAIEDMKTAATEAAKQTEAGVSAYQQEAINRGISNDVLERQKIGGQVLTELEDAKVSLKQVQAAMETAFEYAKCDTHGNNCTGPKRVKKWRELAKEFVDPYYNTVEKVYDALQTAQNAGVDMSQIYMMLNDSCNSWGQYLCPYLPGGQIDYNLDSNGSKSNPRVCKTANQSTYVSCLMKCSNPSTFYNCTMDCEKNKKEDECLPCTMIKTLTKDSEVFDGWVNAETTTSEGNTTVVACASGVVTSSKLLGSLAKKKQGADIVEIEKLETWLAQVEPNKIYGGAKPMDYCDAKDNIGVLEKAMLSKSVSATTTAPLCVEAINSTRRDDEYCGFINPIYAICDIHPYNAGKEGPSKVSEDYDCTDIAKKGKQDDETKYYSKILWAKCKDGKKTDWTVEFCYPEHRPVNEGKEHYCAYDSSWQDGKNADSKYVEAKQKYENEILSRYGETREMIGLKVTVLSQQMYKLYEYLGATLRRLQIQLEKATLKASLEAAGAKTDDDESGLLGGGSGKGSKYRNCNGKDLDETLVCLRENYAALDALVSSKKCDRDAKKQMENDIKIMNRLLPENRPADKDKKCSSPGSVAACQNCLDEYSAGLVNLRREIRDDESKRKGEYYNDKKN